MSVTYQATEVWSDLHHDIVADARGNIKKAINIDAVITSIDNILRTYPSERVMLPTFASSLHDIVFELMDDHTAELMTSGIREAIEKWDDRVIVNSANLVRVPDQNYMELYLSFTIRGYDRIFEHKFTVKEG